MAPGRRRLIILVLTAAGAMFPARAALAQTLGALRGQVTDQGGAPLVGVTIVAGSAGLAIDGRGAITDGAGLFQILSLPPAGDYALLASFPGLAAVRLTDIEVRPGLITSIRLTLVPETAVMQRVEVRARPQIVTLEETTTQTRFSAEFIDALPLLGRNYQDLLSLAPGVSDVDGDGNPNVHGARDTDLITLVDGVSTTDPLTGKIGAQLNIESIQEIEVKTSGATAEFSRAQGGFANIVTKSGGNEFQGTFKFYWRGSLLDGDGAGTDDPRLHGGVGERGLRDLRFNDFLPFLSLEGPIVRDHAWFFTSHEYVSTEDPVNAVSTAFVTGLREWREFVKLTWQAGANHRLALSLNYDPQTFLNQGLNSLVREESGFTQRQGGLVVTLKDVSILTPLLALETSVSGYDERPERTPTRTPDTNRNGFISADRNHDGFISASERDPGEDYDDDGHFDVFEKDVNGDGVADRSEDLDRDGRLTQPGRAGLGGGCEGALREDLDCDGHLDFVDEDQNKNGRLDPGEDIDGDQHLDRGIEDRNGNSVLDDTPFPAGNYPYGELTPRPRDRAYSIDQGSRITSGPYYEDYFDRRRRFTLRQDLSVHVPDYKGSHDIKTGLVFERESFDRRSESRGLLAPFIPQRRDPRPATVRTLMPAESAFENSASGLSAGIYFQDNYKPFPNLSLGLGLRFDRERLDSFGYTPFEPAQERDMFNRIMALAGDEGGKDDFLEGDNDGLRGLGVLSDPIFVGSNRDAAWAIINPLRTAAVSRLTRHHLQTPFQLSLLGGLFPSLVTADGIDFEALARLGIRAQQREPFAITNNNLAPRLSVSWDPASTGRTKLFATWGRYYDRLFLSTVVGEEGPDYVNGYYALDPSGITGSGTPDAGIGRLISRAPPSTTQVSRSLATPFSDELTVGFEREIVPEVAVSLTYVNRRFRRQLQDIDINHELRFQPGTTTPRDDFGLLAQESGDPSAGAGERAPDGRPDLYVRNFFFNQVLRVGNYNESRYQALELVVLRRLSRRWQLQGSYTWSRAVGAAEDFQSQLGNDPSTVQSEFGYLDFDQRHVVKLNAMIYLPRDWQLGLSASWASGLPYSVVTKFFALDNVGYQQYRTLYGLVERAPDGTGHFETLRRNSFRNAATYDFNLRLRRSFVLGRSVAAMFLEVFNLLNSDDLRIFTYEPVARSNFDPANPSAGVPLQLDAQRRFGRRFQLGLQFEF